MKAKLVIQVEGEEAVAFLHDIGINIRDMREGWNEDNPKAVTSLSSKLGHGW